MSETILVTGGAGYIGSHMGKELSRQGFNVVVIDNLSTGHPDSVKYGQLIRGDLRVQSDLLQLMTENRFDAVMHFAAACYVGESVFNPSKYYANNVIGTLNLLEAMRLTQSRRIVFSSSCATYGTPSRLPIDEAHAQLPVNPYGMTKLAGERAIADYAQAYGISAISLRYFNAAGCDPEGELGERHDPETHLIPLILREASRVRAGGVPAQTDLRVNGQDFDTPDGTCIRDYVHVQDIAIAHLRALERLFKGPLGEFEAFNLGTGKGHSVMEVIRTCVEVTEVEIPYVVGARRPGDPAALVATAHKAHNTLGWRPRFVALREIVETAWASRRT
jgi:UDP-glucose 4-epimerase